MTTGLYLVIFSILSLLLSPRAWNYPNATTEVRRAIRTAHIAYITGLLWFWATDPSVDASLHAEMATVGHCTDEYVYVYVWV